MKKLFRKLLVFILNRFTRRKQPYAVEWVEDLPDKMVGRTIYMLGGRQYPFYAVTLCPRDKCSELIQLPVSEEFDEKKRWDFEEHTDGTMTLWPSIHITGLPCRCHYWIRRGQVVWSENPRSPAPRRQAN